jgi:hypothetical protein
MNRDFAALNSRNGARRGRTLASGTILVNRTMKMEEILCTIVHEGRHTLDMKAGRIPKPSQATVEARAFAELSAHRDAADFARLNQFTEAQAYRHSQLSPQELAISIVSSYANLRRISDKALMEVITRVYESEKRI